MRRVASRSLAAGSALLLAACASGGATSSPWGQYFELLQQGFSNTFGGGAITRDQAAATPYASLGYRLNGGPQGLVVLATNINGEQLWTSSAHIVLVTQDGRVTRSVGLAHDIGRLVPSSGTTLPRPALAMSGPLTVTLMADFPDIASYSVPLTCHLAAMGVDPITILGQAIATTRVEENCESPQLGWRFRNSYWLDPTSGFAWRSLQHLTPKGDTIETEILRPPG